MTGISSKNPGQDIAKAEKEIQKIFSRVKNEK